MSLTLLALCAIGAFVAARMQVKAMRDRAGLLSGPSVVQSERARVLGEMPNSLVGLIYYAAMGVASFFIQMPAIHGVCIAAASLAAAMSIYLAYSLLFVTRMPCVLCWTGHAVNWLLLAMLLYVR